MTKHNAYSMFAFLTIILFMLPTLQAFSETSELQEYGLLWSFKTNSTVRDVAISADGSKIAVGSRKAIYLLDDDGELLWSYDHEVKTLSLSGNGRWIIAAIDPEGLFNEANNFVIFNEYGNLIARSSNYGFYDITSVSISNEGSIVVYHRGEITYGYRVAYCNYPYGIITPKLCTTIYTYLLEGKASISSNGEYIFTCGEGLWDDWLVFLDRNGREIWCRKESLPYERQFSVSISANGDIMAFADDEKLYLFDRKGNGKLLLNFNRSWNTVDISVSPDGNYVVYAAESAGFLNNLYSFLILDTEGRWRWVAKTPVSYVATSSNADYIVAGYGDKVLLFARKRICAAKALEKARSVVSDVTLKGFSVKYAEALLSQAQASFEAGLNDETIKLASEACSLAKDIDRDGVLNEDDFAPYVNNNLIYMGIAGLLIILILACRAYVSRRRGVVYMFDKEEGTLTSIR